MRRRELLTSMDDWRFMSGSYENVDLHLTGDCKNLIWFTSNVRVTAETEYGNYYQWGAGSTKYANRNQYHTGGTDSTYTLPLTADTVYLNFSGDCRMPTRAEFSALTAQTDYKWETNFNSSGVNGGKFTSKVNPKAYIFFPAAGRYNAGSLNDEGSRGNVWSSSPNSSSNAYYLRFGSGGNSVGSSYRYYGQSVRGVFPKYEMVDLGLPSGIKWATCNFGVNIEASYGRHSYVWGNTNIYERSKTAYSGTSNLPRVLDVCNLMWPRPNSVYWKMPTSAQCQELIDNTTYQWVTDFNSSGVNGAKFTSNNNGNYIFFPADGYRYNNDLTDVGNSTYIWTSTPTDTDYAYRLKMDSSGTEISTTSKSDYGLSVRGVHT